MSFAALQEAVFAEGKKQVAAVRDKHQKQISQEEERISRQARELEEVASQIGRVSVNRSFHVGLHWLAARTLYSAPS